MFAFGEILIILLVAIIFLSPKELIDLNNRFIVILDNSIKKIKVYSTKIFNKKW
jgi:hypothetical protein